MPDHGRAAKRAAANRGPIPVRRRDLRTWSVASVDARAPVPPRYDGPGVASIIPALLGAVDAAWLPAPVHDARSVVLLVVDGLGFEALDAHRVCPAAGPRPRGLTSDDRRAVDDGIGAHVDHDRARPVRARAGRLPDAHRRRGAQRALVAVGRSQATGSRASVQRHAPFRGRPIPVVTKSEFRAQRLHRGAPARWPIPRLACVVVARRAVPAARRRGGALDLRVLPGRRRGRPRCTGCATASTRRSSRSPIGSSAISSTSSPATPRSS